ncbi:MAG: YbaB/EbfC family nucleoid-associated protein [Ruminococcaceae bacterium]|jgi:hypothetical protein|nr:YbaB/EbfC family nucleoid-associated protein [Oscillospiraceae bacterium]
MKARIPNAPQGNMMQRLQQMQDNMQKTQEEVEQGEYTASAGGGMVEVTVSGKHEIKSIKLQEDVVDKDDIEMLEDLLTAAINEAMHKVDSTMEQKMGEITGGLNIPGLGGLGL